MKKIFYILFIMIMMSAAKVYAAGGITVSPGSINLQPGSSKTITITATNAAGRVDISSSNPSVVTVSKKSSWVENGKVTVTIKAVGEGNAKINVKLTDVATFDGKVLTGTKTVTVVSKKKEADKTDATLSKLIVKDYEIGFDKSKLVYSFDVPNNVTSLSISATPSSSAAKASIGKSDNLKLVVTAGNGTTKEYVLKVNRRDDIPEATFDNINEVIKTTTKDTIAIKVTDDTIITKDVINIVKNNNKNLIINKYNGGNKIEYSLILDKSLLNDSIDANVDFNPSNIEDVYKTINYSEGIYFKINNLNSGKIKVFVANKYNDDHKLNILSYKDNKVSLLYDNISVENGYVTFDLSDAENYVITRAKLISDKKVVSDSSSNIFLSIAIVEFVGLIGLGSFTFVKLKRNVI